MYKWIEINKLKYVLLEYRVDFWVMYVLPNLINLKLGLEVIKLSIDYESLCNIYNIQL